MFLSAGCQAKNASPVIFLSTLDMRRAGSTGGGGRAATLQAVVVIVARQDAVEAVLGEERGPILVAPLVERRAIFGVEVLDFEPQLDGHRHQTPMTRR